MADSLTYYIGLIKPEVGGSDDTWGEKTNSNWDRMDYLIGTGSLNNTPSKIYVDDADALRVLKAGDTMSGFLTLHLDPTSPFHAATKQYVDAITAVVTGKVSKAGDAMTGLLILSANPAAALGAATKQYVDAVSAITLTAGAGLTGGGNLTANRTFDVGAGTGIVVAADTVGLDTAHVRNIDHSAVSIITGTGLTGGGDLTATRNLLLANAAALTLKGNITGGAAAPLDHTITAFLDAVIGPTRGMVMRRGSATWQALALGTNGQALKSNGTDVVYGAVYGVPRRLRSTNLLANPYFNDVLWTWTKSNADMIGQAYSNAEPMNSSFGNRLMQLASAGGNLNVGHPTDFRVDKAKAYQAGFWGYGGSTVTFKLANLNGISQEITTTNIGSATLIAGGVTPATINNANIMVTMRPVGGGAPQWDTATVGAAFRIERGASGLFMGACYFVAHDHWPAPIAVGSLPTPVNGGVGTHEAVYDPATGMLYVISHSYDYVTKYDTTNNLQKPASNNSCATGATYPHDITLLGGFIYVACFNGNSVVKIDKATMTVSATYGLGRAGISICNNGTNVYIGAGTPVETSFLMVLTVATGVASLVSADCGGGLANLPVLFLPGVTNEVWTIKTANSEVKRISTGGGTVATYACALGAIYGLGYDNNSLIYANCEDGIAVIDPATATPGGVGTILKKYLFRQTYGGASNMRVDDLGRMWGCTNSGVFMLDHSVGRLHEMPAGFLGGPKWVCNIPGQGMALGYYVMPSIDILG